MFYSAWRQWGLIACLCVHSQTISIGEEFKKGYEAFNLRDDHAFVFVGGISSVVSLCGVMVLSHSLSWEVQYNDISVGLRYYQIPASQGETFTMNANGNEF